MKSGKTTSKASKSTRSEEGEPTSCHFLLPWWQQQPDPVSLPLPTGLEEGESDVEGTSLMREAFLDE